MSFLIRCFDVKMLGSHDVHPMKINWTEARLNCSGQACFEGLTMVIAVLLSTDPTKPMSTMLEPKTVS